MISFPFSIYEHTSINLQKKFCFSESQKKRDLNFVDDEIVWKKKWQTIWQNYIDTHFFRTIFTKSVLQSVQR